MESKTEEALISKQHTENLKRNGHQSSTIVYGPTYHNDSSKPSLPPTFWTICTTCKVQYEYLRKYVNKRLSCKNCRSAFMAVELGIAPVHESYPVSQFSYGNENGYSTSHGYNNGSFFPNTSGYVSGNGVPGYHSGHGSFQWSVSHGSSTGYGGDTFYQSNGYLGKPEKKMKQEVGLSVKVTRPYKKRKVELRGNSAINNMEASVPNVNNESFYKRSFSEFVDIRSMLIEKARTVIKTKLEELKSDLTKNGEKPGESQRRENMGTTQLNPGKLGPVSLTVPDSDFHDFDKDRTEECFQPKQIWALYDEEDGMPRLYCLIRQIISVNPFRIHISYLSSKTDTEFGSVNWIDSGFTKSCGHFRATNSDVISEVNMFSHVLPREKAGRGGCVRIFPRSGDVWAVYRNWSKDWNRSTPYDVRHQYEMVEVLDDYNEEVGVSVVPLVKLEGYKTVYQRTRDENSVWRVPRREMVRFSHKVPSWLIKGNDLPEGCWDLDPAAIPDELLRSMKDFEVEDLDKVSEKVSLNNQVQGV